MNKPVWAAFSSAADTTGANRIRTSQLKVPASGIPLVGRTSCSAGGLGQKNYPGAARLRSRAFRAWSRCQRVRAHSSSRMVFLAARSDRAYRRAVVFVTALRSLIESSMAHSAGPADTTPADAPLRGHYQMILR